MDQVTCRVEHGDCLEVLKSIPDDSIDSLVTDPPAGISFMGKAWDDDKGGRDEWIKWLTTVMRECHRVMRPGAHGLVWAIPRTSHWTGMALESAGFEVRDRIAHVFGQGFPKSLDISKAIDKQAGAERTQVVGMTARPDGSKPRKASAGFGQAMNCFGEGSIPDGRPVTAPATDDAKTWAGWGTALKPAMEDWWLIRKPISEKNVAQNVLKHGTGGINVDGSRIEAVRPAQRYTAPDIRGGNFNAENGDKARHTITQPENLGRFPSNFVLSHTPFCEPDQCDIECAIKGLDEQSLANGMHSAGKARTKVVDSHYNASSFDMSSARQMNRVGDSGGASRFFYCAKISTSERHLGCEGLLTWENADQSLVELTEELSQLAKGISVDITLLQSESSWSTGLYGHSISEQYPKGLMFIIETVTRLITELKTSNYSVALNTSASILDAIRTIEASGLSLAESVAFTSQLDLTTTDDVTASVLGASRAVLPTLSKIRDCAKQGNIHSTVKPQKLMRYLINLITPPNGLVLDPFAGSGSTGVAAKSLGFGFIGIEREAEYVAIAAMRIGIPSIELKRDAEVSHG